MNDAQCDKHLIQWSTEERGEECPACILEAALKNIVDAIEDENDPAFFSSIPSERDILLLSDAKQALLKA